LHAAARPTPQAAVENDGRGTAEGHCVLMEMLPG
jgi:hypothetical protein